MPWPLNRVNTQDNYANAVTAQFPTGRKHFSLQIYTAGVFYRLISFEPPNNYQTDPTEHFLAPVLANFDDPASEGLGDRQLFGGIQLRSAVPGTPAVVTVI